MIREFEKSWLLTLLCTPLMLAASTVKADDLVAAPLRSPQLQPPVGAVEILSLGTSLILVVGLILIVGWLYARAQGIRGGNNSAISIVATQSLGPKEKILVVEIAGEQLVLGMTSSQIRTLHVLQGRVASEAVVLAGAGFADRFREALRGVRK